MTPELYQRVDPALGFGELGVRTGLNLNHERDLVRHLHNHIRDRSRAVNRSQRDRRNNRSTFPREVTPKVFDHFVVIVSLIRGGDDIGIDAVRIFEALAVVARPAYGIAAICLRVDAASDGCLSRPVRSRGEGRALLRPLAALRVTCRDSGFIGVEIGFDEGCRKREPVELRGVKVSDRNVQTRDLCESDLPVGERAGDLSASLEQPVRLPVVAKQELLQHGAFLARDDAVIRPRTAYQNAIGAERYAFGIDRKPATLRPALMQPPHIVEHAPEPWDLR